MKIGSEAISQTLKIEKLMREGGEISPLDSTARELNSPEIGK